MASVIFDISLPTNDPWELLYLANGDPLQSTYDSATTTITNPSVTQPVLDQALLDYNAGMVSTQKQSQIKAETEDGVTQTDIALAILGDPTSVAKLQTLVNVTAPTTSHTLPAVPPVQAASSINMIGSSIPPVATDDVSKGYTTGSIWSTTTGSFYICIDSTTNSAVWFLLDHTVIKNNSTTIAPAITDDISKGYSVGSIWNDTTSGVSYICTSVSPANALWLPINRIINKFAATVVGGVFTTLMTDIPFTTHPMMIPNGFTNIGGLITSLNGGDYMISCTLPFTSTKKDKLHSIQIMHNNTLASPIYTISSGKKKANSFSISNFPVSLLPNDTISIQQLGVNGSTYSAHLTIVPWGI